MNIAYFSSFTHDIEIKNQHQEQLAKIGRVIFYDLDYSRGHESIAKTTLNFILEHEPDILVGANIGGWMAAYSGTSCGIPFVAMNPELKPHQTFARYSTVPDVGSAVSTQFSHSDIIDNWPDFRRGGCGLILLEADDPVVESDTTRDTLESVYEVHYRLGGGHHYTLREEDLKLIETFYDSAGLVYGLC